MWAAQKSEEVFETLGKGECGLRQNRCRKVSFVYFCVQCRLNKVRSIYPESIQCVHGFSCIETKEGVIQDKPNF